MANGTKSGRRSLFPKYEVDLTSDEHPIEQAAAYLSKWGARVVLVATVGGLCVAALVTVGVQWVGRPSTILHRIDRLEDTVAATSRRLTDDEKSARSTLYVSCQVLQRVNPPGAIVPEQCGGVK